ncbi:MAG TPA: MMPL family transporter [candidate division Zixibacteria bacterium]
MVHPKHRLVRLAVNHPRMVIGVAVVITILLAIPIPFAVIDTDPENMLAADEPVRLAHHRIKEEFDLSDFLVLGFVDDKELLTPVFNDKLAALVTVIEEMEGVVVGDVWAPSTLDDIYRTPDSMLVVGPLMQDRQGWGSHQPSPAEKIRQNPILRGKVASDDGLAAAVYIPLESKSYAHDVAEHIHEWITADSGFPAFHLAGLPVAEETFGKQMFRQMGIAAPAAGLLIFLLMLVFFRRLSVVAAPMIVAMMTVIWTMGLLVAAGFTLHIMSSMIPIFLMPIAVLDSIHLLSEFHDRYQRSTGAGDAITGTMNELYSPMLLTSLTTFVGFVSLVSAPIPPVRVFGVFVALGVAIAFVLTVTFNTAYAILLPSRTLTNFGRQDEGGSLLGRVLPRVGRLAMRARHAVLIGSAALIALAFIGITRIEINDNPTKWFKPSHPIRIADDQLGRHLAGPYLAYLEFDATDTPAGTVKDAAVLRQMEGLQRRLDQMPQVGSTTGITDIVKKVRYELKNGDSAYYAIPDGSDEIAQELFLYEAAGGDPGDLFKFITPDGAKAALWVQMRDGDNRSVRAVVDAAAQFNAQSPPPAGLDFAWGGLSYVNVIWQEKMVSGMRNALLGSFAVVLIMMILLLRSVSLGLISMVPLSLTITVVYGAIGWIGKPYDMPIAILSSLTLGLSIDFAIHFLKRGQDLFAQNGSLRATLEALFEEPARAIARNIFVIALGFVPLLFSDLVPYVTVGTFFLLIMFLSGFATFLILPALMMLRRRRGFASWGQSVESAGRPAAASDPVIEEVSS